METSLNSSPLDSAAGTAATPVISDAATSATSAVSDRPTLRDMIERGSVLLLDGSMGVMLQRRGLTEAEARGERLAGHSVNIASDFDLLCLTRPEAVTAVHEAYLEAGADIIETNTFNANRLSQADYAAESLVRDINLAGARLARAAADRATAADPSRPRLVAGSMGPTSHSASLPSDVDNPTLRSVDFETLHDAYLEQAEALIEGGVDLLLVETAFDLLNAKAAAMAARRAIDASERDVALAISMTVADKSGRILSGHTPEAVVAALSHTRPAAIGFNCSAGPAGLAGALTDLAALSSFPTIFYPNAGLPDKMGAYSLGPDEFTAEIEPLLGAGVLNIVGGCCGTTPDHIAALRRAIDSGSTPRRAASRPQRAWLAGLDPFADGRGFINVGERCNVAGSRKFLRLIKEGARDEALAIARRQVEDGAMILDINMDDPMVDIRAEMRDFLRLLGSDPATAAVPWMIDSSDFGVIVEALRNVGGKAVVNSISLKHGEEAFVEEATEIARYGAAVVVMLFDEQGQATTFERKIEIAGRACRILTERCGYDPRDIIFDPNVLTVATGMAEHDRYALDYIRAVGWISSNLPGAKTSGGVSNLSFAFRGNNYLRQAMHAVFLYHAIEAGLSMAILDPSTKVTYSDIPAELLELITDVVLFRRPDAAERLTDAAARFGGEVAAPASGDVGAKTPPADVDDRLILALRTGDPAGLEEDLAEAVRRHSTARAVVEGPLMAGMEEVGRLFEEGKMFLPQVVKSARTMRRAVAILSPLLEADGPAEGEGRKGLVLLATVRGDVHDIGKNIAAVVLRCNNFEVVDLGVQVEPSEIVEAALRLKPDFIGLSGLISPSLEEMARTAEALRDAGVKAPLLVGGAATSDLHTALRIAPAYAPGVVVRVADASRDPVVASKLMADYEGQAAAIRSSQARLVAEHEAAAAGSPAPAPRPAIDWASEPVAPAPAAPGLTVMEAIPLDEVIPLVNFTYLYNCWKVKPGTPEAETLHAEAEALLSELAAAGATMQAEVAFYEAHTSVADPDTIVINGNVALPTPRQRASERRSESLALADYILPEGDAAGRTDHIGCFMATIGPLLRERLEALAGKDADDYARLLLQSVCDRLAEAASEWLHYQVRTRLWGYDAAEPFEPDRLRKGVYRGIRPAVGYPSLPDQRLMHTLASLLRPEKIGVSVTENGALSPSATVAGFYFASPRSRYFTVGTPTSTT